MVYARLPPFGGKVKRVSDLVLSLALAVPVLVILIPLCALIFVETRSTPVFRQSRVGRNRKIFTLYKLRTMHPDTPDRASHDTSDTQITRSGRWIRKLKIDELPQILNVLIGQMSFVGPRPCLPIQHSLIAERDRLGVNNLRPGITGIAQINGIDMSEPALLAEIDSTYAYSFRNDLHILLQTVVGKGSGDAVGRVQKRDIE